MNETYFNNLTKYVVFLRILCQDQISEDDLKDAELIFIDFIREYENLYGKDNMTSNLHAHVHLVAQVRRFGPLTKCSGFAFENMFLISREMYHGTVNFEGQIGRNLIRNQSIKLATNNLYQNANQEIQMYIEKIIDKTHKSNDSLLNSKKRKVSNLKKHQIELIELCNDDEIYESGRALINNKGFRNKFKEKLYVLNFFYVLNFSLSY